MPHPSRSLSHIVRMDAFHGEAGQGLEGAGAPARAPVTPGIAASSARARSARARCGRLRPQARLPQARSKGRAPGDSRGDGRRPASSLGLSAARRPPRPPGSHAAPAKKPGAARARPASSRVAPHAGEAAHLMGRHPVSRRRGRPRPPARGRRPGPRRAPPRPRPPALGDNVRERRLAEAQHVGLMAERHHLGPARGQRLPHLLVEQPPGREGDPRQGEPPALGEHLPGHDVRMVVVGGDDDKIALRAAAARPSRGPPG